MIDEKRKHEAEEKAEHAPPAAKGNSGHGDGNKGDDVEGYEDKSTDPPDASGGT